MDEQIYREKLSSFKDSCRVYKKEKQTLEASVSPILPADRQVLGYLKEDVEYVNHVFSRVKDLFGTSAVLMIWLLFVAEKTQVDVAYQLGITRRQLQYSVSKYMHRVFEEEEHRGS